MYKAIFQLLNLGAFLSSFIFILGILELSEWQSFLGSNSVKKRSTVESSIFLYEKLLIDSKSFRVKLNYQEPYRTRLL